MESLLSPTDGGKGIFNSHSLNFEPYNTDALIIQSISNNPHSTDSVSVDFSELYKSLSVEAKQIVDAINARLEVELPDGIQSLTPDQVTPEATAERIVQGVTGLFGIFEKQNPGLEGEELLDSFMKTIRGGVDQGYAEAIEILDGLGAFKYEGVMASVETTKDLIEKKLGAYEQQMRKVLGIDPPDSKVAAAETAKAEVLMQAGAKTLDLAA